MHCSMGDQMVYEAHVMCRVYILVLLLPRVFDLVCVLLDCSVMNERPNAVPLAAYRSIEFESGIVNVNGIF